MPRYNSGPGGTSRKHHKKKRGFQNKGHYQEKLSARGLTTKSVRMRSLDDLRKRALRGQTGIEDEAQEE